MWLINFLPQWIFHALFFIGVLTLAASLILKIIPVLSQYKTTVQIVSVLLILIAVWFEGAISCQQAWEARVEEMETKVTKAESESKVETERIVQKVVNKTEIIRERGEQVTNYIDREVVKYDNSCVILKEFIEAHNKAAEPFK
jgi:translation elongation factor EF-Tu-like GTPase